MIKRFRNMSLFVIGLLATAIGLPVLNATALPSFDVVLYSMFGEGSISALLFAALLIGMVLLCMKKLVESYQLRG
ncbi:hypothetical protein ABE021_01305 [Sporosarcina gallistercoris]|uniref:hypothetical protein n=1 Tax=Sporosarcina gallistercoris TaxID=2762245 RepID=UPI003D2E2A1C